MQMNCLIAYSVSQQQAKFKRDKKIVVTINLDKVQNKSPYNLNTH